MIKMVVSSFYNTLIDSEEAIPSSTIVEIERIRSNGIKFAVCTNGLNREVLDYNKDFPFIDYIISLNGSYVYDVKKERSILNKKLTKNNISKIIKLFPNSKIYYYTEDNFIDYYREDIDIYKIEIEILDIKEKELIIDLLFL